MNSPCVLIKKINPDAKIPTYQTNLSSGADLSCINDIVFEKPGEIQLVHTGIQAAVPRNYEIQIRPRSSLAAKGFLVVNSPGTIDADYRGEILILLGYFGKNPKAVLPAGSRIAQAVVAPVAKAEFIEVEHELPPTQRGNKGLGSTGL